MLHFCFYIYIHTYTHLHTYIYLATLLNGHRNRKDEKTDRDPKQDSEPCRVILFPFRRGGHLSDKVSSSEMVLVTRMQSARAPSFPSLLASFMPAGRDGEVSLYPLHSPSLSLPSTHLLSVHPVPSHLSLALSYHGLEMLPIFLDFDSFFPVG